MSDITDQAEFDALRQTYAAYEDSSNTNFNSSGDVTITLRPGYIFRTDQLRCSGQTTLIADECIVNIEVKGDGGEGWEGGQFRCRNGQVVTTHTGTGNTNNQQWPAWIASSTGRPTFDIAGCTFRSPNAGEATLHLGCMAEGGSNFTGLTLDGWGFFLPFGYTPLVGVTFSGAEVADSGTGIPGTPAVTNMRSQKATGTGAGTIKALYSGLYGCDTTAWLASAQNSANVVIDLITSVVDGQTKFYWFIVDNNSSTVQLSDGFACKVGDNGFDRLPTDFISGQSWLPRFNDDLTGSEITDITLDLGTNNVWAMGDGSTLTLPVRTLSDGTNNYVTLSGSKGIMVENDYQVVISDSTIRTLLDVNISTITGISVYTYTHECYTSSGNVKTVTSTPAVMEGEMQTDQSTYDVSSLGSESGLLNSRTLATATSLSMSDLDDLYAILKSTAINNTDELIQFSVAGSKISIGTGIWTLTTATSLTSTNTNVRTSATLTGGDIFDGFVGNAFRSFLAVTMGGDVSIDMATSINMNNITDGASSNLFKAPTITNIPTTVKSKYQNTNTINFSSATTFEETAEVTGNITGSVGGNTMAGTYGGNITLSGTGNNSMNATVAGNIAVTGTGNNTVNGAVVGNISLTSTGNHTISSGASCVDLILSGTSYIIDGTVTGDTTVFAGNATVNGSLKDTSHVSGTMVLGGGGSIDGTLSKNGSGNANSLTMTPAQAATVDLVVTTGTLELFGVVRADFKSVSGLTSDNLASTTTTFEVPSGLPTGRAILKLRGSADNVFIFDSTHTTGSKTTLGTITNVSGSTTTYDMYFKPTNVYGDNGIFYLTTSLIGNIDSNVDVVNTITHVEHPDVLTSAAEKITTSAAAAMNAVTGTIGTVLISGATDEINAPTTQHVLMRVTDEDDYLRLMANNVSSVDLIYPGSNDGTVVDISKVTLTSLASDGQQLLTAISSTGSGTLSGQITTSSAITAVLVASNPAGITVPQVEGAIRPLTDSIENRVADVADHMEIDLSGIDPKDAYNPDTDYKT